jgi:hypothetical protein
MEAINLEEGELYVFRARPRVSEHAYPRQYAGKTAIYLGFEPNYEEHYGEFYERYKFLLNGQLRYLHEAALKFLDLPDV